MKVNVTRSSPAGSDEGLETLHAKSNCGVDQRHNLVAISTVKHNAVVLLHTNINSHVLLSYGGCLPTSET